MYPPDGPAGHKHFSTLLAHLMRPGSVPPGWSGSLVVRVSVKFASMRPGSVPPRMVGADPSKDPDKEPASMRPGSVPPRMGIPNMLLGAPVIVLQ